MRRLRKHSRLCNQDLTRPCPTRIVVINHRAIRQIASPPSCTLSLASLTVSETHLSKTLSIISSHPSVLLATARGSKSIFGAVSCR